MTPPDTDRDPPAAPDQLGVQRFDDVYDRYIPTVMMQPDPGHSHVWRSAQDHTLRMRCRPYDRLTRFFALWRGAGRVDGPRGELLQRVSLPISGCVGRLPAMIDVVADNELMLWLPTSNADLTVAFDTGRAVRVRIVDDGVHPLPTLALLAPATIHNIDDHRP